MISNYKIINFITKLSSLSMLHKSVRNIYTDVVHASMVTQSSNLLFLFSRM